MAILCGRLVESKVNGTRHRTPVKPAISVNTDSLTGKLLQIAVLVN